MSAFDAPRPRDPLDAHRAIQADALAVIRCACNRATWIWINRRWPDDERAINASVAASRAIRGAALASARRDPIGEGRRRLIALRKAAARLAHHLRALAAIQARHADAMSAEQVAEVIQVAEGIERVALDGR